MACLANAGIIGVPVGSIRVQGVQGNHPSAPDGARCRGDVHVAPNEEGISADGVTRIAGVIIHVPAMTIGTLNILTIPVVAFLAGMATGADVDAVGTSPAQAGSQQVAGRWGERIVA